MPSPTEEPLYIAYQPGYIHSSAKIGKGTRIGAGHDISKDVVIGENCLIQCHVSIPTGTVIGDNVFIGPGVKMANDKYMVGVDAVDDSHLEPPVIESNARIGLGALIGAGVRIGQGACVGQGANVIHDVEPYTMVVGNPARYLYRVDVNGKPFRRECLGMKCKSWGDDNCNLNPEAIVECAYVRGDKVKMENWLE